MVRAAEGESQERLLLSGLPLHIHVVEEVADALVCEYPSIELVDSGVDGGIATQSLVEAGSHVLDLLFWIRIAEQLLTDVQMLISICQDTSQSVEMLTPGTHLSKIAFRRL
jgi:hypothetical protein